MAPQESASYYGALVMDREEKSAPASSVSKSVVIAVLASLAIVGGVAFLGSSTSEVQQSAVVNVDDCQCDGDCMPVRDTDWLQGYKYEDDFKNKNVHMCISSSQTVCSDLSNNPPVQYKEDGEFLAMCAATGAFMQHGAQSECNQVEGNDGTDRCGEQGWCMTNPDSVKKYSCICNTGWGIADWDCDNIKECESSDTNECHDQAQCHDTEGSYTCQCNEGWEGSGIGPEGCTDIDVCLLGHECDHGDCMDGSAAQENFGYTCECHIGWDADDKFCETDIDECMTNNCPLNTKCTNTDGSFLCSCNDNWQEESQAEGDPKSIVCGYINRCDPTPCLNGGTCLEGTPGCGVDQTNELASNYLNLHPGLQYQDVALSTEVTYDVQPCFTCVCDDGWRGALCGEDIDECAEDLHTCDENADCVNTAGSYECVCHLGWEMVNVAEEEGQVEMKCEDIDDCKDISPCAHGGTCTDCGCLCFTCECVVGWRGTTCGTDWDECKMGIHICNDEATCKNNPGSYDCICDPGWTGDGFGDNHAVEDGIKSTLSAAMLADIATARADAAAYMAELKLQPGCVDLNDCGNIPEEDPCMHGNCVDLGTNHYHCACDNGWRDSNCDMDINECNPTESVLIECSPFATCHNKNPTNQRQEVGYDAATMPLGYSCSCNKGYTGNGVVCTDIDDCVDDDGDRRCDEHGFCSDQGTDFYTCNCDNGWIGQDCDMDENECILGKDNCGRNAICTNTIGSFTCSCKNGYEGDPTQKCTDIDDCNAAGRNPCANGAKCENMGIGSYLCTCVEGWTDFNCDFDINECLEEGFDKCHTDAVCRNTPGSYTCTCLAGYKGDGFECVDIDDCAEVTEGAWHEIKAVNGGCIHGDCQNLPGNARICSCHEGYRGCNDPFCKTDCNECDEDPCHSAAACTLDPPLYTCTCQGDWYGTGEVCSQCTKCPIGYKVDKACTNVADTICTNIDECFTRTDDCHPEHGGCQDTQGSYLCECEIGYWGDGWNAETKRNKLGCTKCTECFAGFHEIQPCTATSDRVCGADLQMGDYMIESEADGTKQCLAIMNEEWFPTRQFLGNGDDYCGIAVDETSDVSPLQLVKANSAFVWKITPMYSNQVGKNNQLFTISHANTDSAYEGGGNDRCLYFGNGGKDVYPSLQSCIDYQSDCPWGYAPPSLTQGSLCDFQVADPDASREDIKEALIQNGQAIFQIKAVKLVEKKYIIQARARSNGNWECLAFEDQGAATNPSRYNWGNGEDWCGVGDWDGYGKEMALLNNKQAVFIFTQLSG